MYYSQDVVENVAAKGGGGLLLMATDLGNKTNFLKWHFTM
jgi:hypothetical protein